MITSRFIGQDVLAAEKIAAASGIGWIATLFEVLYVLHYTKKLEQ